MSNDVPASVAVIGSGVIGLTSAIRLREAGYAVTIYAQTTPPNTTSDVAAAYWAPGALFGGPRMARWAETSWHLFHALLAEPNAGIALLPLYELSTEPITALPANLPGNPTRVPSGRFPTPWSGFSMTVPRIDVPIYMPWLFQRALALGITIQTHTVTTFAELAGLHRIIVNCSGLGARTLTTDELYPIRGQVIRIRKPPGLEPAIISAEVQDEITYIIPRSQDCLLGGTYHYGDSRTEVDGAIAAGILARCAQFDPALATPEILQHRVGLRPGRRAVRLEREVLPGGMTVIHNYGHGSLGHTLSWGCAVEVVGLVSLAFAT
jgi:D-amino-acid oxidase